VACFTQHDLDVNHHVFTTWPHIFLKLMLECGLPLEQCVTLKSKPLSRMTPILAAERAIRKSLRFVTPRHVECPMLSSLASKTTGAS